METLPPDLRRRFLIPLWPRDRAVAACVCPEWRDMVATMPPLMELELPLAIEDDVAEGDNGVSCYLKGGGMNINAMLLVAVMPNDAGICVWDAITANVLRILPHTTPIPWYASHCEFLTPQTLFVMAPELYRVIDVRTGDITRDAMLVTDLGRAICVSARPDCDGTWLAIMHEADQVAVYQLHDTDDGEEAIPPRYELLLHVTEEDMPPQRSTHSSTLHYSPDGEKLAVALDYDDSSTLHVWQIEENYHFESFHEITRHLVIGDVSADVMHLVWSVDSRFVALSSASNTTLKVCDTLPDSPLPEGFSIDFPQGEEYTRWIAWGVSDEDPALHLLLAVYDSGHVVRHSIRVDGAHVHTTSRVLARHRTAGFARFVLGSHHVLVASLREAFFVCD